MSANAVTSPVSEVVQVFSHCTQVLRRESVNDTMPLLRIERGAALIRGRRAQHVVSLLEPLLSLAASRLYVAVSRPMNAGCAARVMVKPKVRVSLTLGGAGLVARVRYFGEAPRDDELQAAFATHSAARPLSKGSSMNLACALPSVTVDGAVLEIQAAFFQSGELIDAALQQANSLARGEVCLQAVWHEGLRRWSVVKVMAGERIIAVPMFAVAQAVSDDSMVGEPPPTVSLAHCLGELPKPSQHGRPAMLILRRRGEPLALSVESLIGHGEDIVHPVGPMLQMAPWILGVIQSKHEGQPVLVVDPLGLPGWIDA